MISLIVKNTQTGDIFDLPFNSIQMDEELNAGEAARMQFEFRAIESVARYYGTDVPFLLTGGKRQIIVRKDAANIFIGNITDFNLSKDNKDGLKMDVAAAGFFTFLSKRRTLNKREFVNTDAGLIAWTLISESQTSDPPYSGLGITQGLIQTSVNRSVVYRFADIRQEITRLSNNFLKNGFDFDIDNNGIFSVFFPFKGSNRPNIVFDEANLLSWGIRKPLLLSLANKVYVVGAGFNDTVVFATRNSPNEYKTAFGLLEEVVSDRNIKETPVLEDKGDKYLLDFQSPILGLTINHEDNKPDILDYEVGDSVKVTIPELNLTEAFRRIYRRSMRIDSNGKMTVQLDLK